MLDTFITALMTDGKILVSPLAKTVEPGPAIDAAIMELDARARAECPGTAPALDPGKTMQAIRILHHACMLLVFRDAEARGIPIIEPGDAGTHWSVDLAFRHLPVLWKQARSRASGDPLVDWIAGVVRPWPLSAVGIPLAPPPDPTPILDHPGLAREYLDRCLAAQDGERLRHPRVRPAAMIAVGAHASLLPANVSTLLAESQP